jgi:hypothetical protein
MFACNALQIADRKCGFIYPHVGMLLRQLDVPLQERINCGGVSSIHIRQSLNRRNFKF